MKVTKARLKKHVEMIERQVIFDIKQEKRVETRRLIETWWEKQDPDLKELQAYFDVTQAEQIQKNRLVDFINDKDIYVYNFFRINKPYIDFKDFKRSFFDRVKEGEIPDYTDLDRRYEKEKQKVRTNYQAIRSNLENLTAKKGLVYLEELGIDVEEFKSEEAQLPMVQVDIAALRLPAKEVNKE